MAPVAAVGADAVVIGVQGGRPSGTAWVPPAPARETFGTSDQGPATTACGLWRGGQTPFDTQIIHSRVSNALRLIYSVHCVECQTPICTIAPNALMYMSNTFLYATYRVSNALLYTKS